MGDRLGIPGAVGFCIDLMGLGCVTLVWHWCDIDIGVCDIDIGVGDIDIGVCDIGVIWDLIVTMEF